MPASQTRDPYTVLGIPRHASEAEIRGAYRRLARKLHPDINKASDAAAKFIEIQEAFEILSDPERRRTYDDSSTPSPAAGGNHSWPHAEPPGADSWSGSEHKATRREAWVSRRPFEEQPIRGYKNHIMPVLITAIVVTASVMVVFVSLASPKLALSSARGVPDQSQGNAATRGVPAIPRAAVRLYGIDELFEGVPPSLMPSEDGWDPLRFAEFQAFVGSLAGRTFELERPIERVEVGYPPQAVPPQHRGFFPVTVTMRPEYACLGALLVEVLPATSTVWLTSSDAAALRDGFQGRVVHRLMIKRASVTEPLANPPIGRRPPRIALEVGEEDLVFTSAPRVHGVAPMPLPGREFLSSIGTDEEVMRAANRSVRVEDYVPFSPTSQSFRGGLLETEKGKVYSLELLASRIEMSREPGCRWTLRFDGQVLGTGNRDGHRVRLTTGTGENGCTVTMSDRAAVARLLDASRMIQPTGGRPQVLVVEAQILGVTEDRGKRWNPETGVVNPIPVDWYTAVVRVQSVKPKW